MEKQEKEERKTEEMLIGKIYDEVCVPMFEKDGNTDGEMGEKLMLLTENTDLEHMDKVQLADRICKGAVIGQKEGFLCGVRFMAKLICESLM